jgi:hypothetical protein
MAGVIRSRLLTRLFGGGPGAVAGAAVVSWGLRKVREGRQPEVLNVSRLVPGETYTVGTRPAPDRKERRLAKRSARLHRRLEKELRPTRAQRRADRRFRRFERKAVRADAGSAAEAKWARRARGVATWRMALSTPTKRQRSLERKASSVDQALEKRRQKALARSRKHTRTVRRRYT